MTTKIGERKKISVVLVTFNCGRKVESTIESVLAQKKDLFELIVIDGESTDETLCSIKKYESDLTLISEKDGGVYDAFNKGIDISCGEYLYFIGAGDKLRGNVFELVDNFSSDLQLPLLLYGDAFITKDQIPYGGVFCASRLAVQNICHQAIFYHRSIFKLIGKYELQYRLFADWALNLKCFGHHEIVKRYINHFIVDFEGGGLSAQAEDIVFKRNASRLIRKHLGVISYITYKFPQLTSIMYWKIYFPLIRPLITTVRK